jgi:hypothetical protein
MSGPETTAFQTRAANVYCLMPWPVLSTLSNVRCRPVSSRFPRVPTDYFCSASLAGDDGQSESFS